MKDPPDVLFVMTDQQRFDTIAALGNRHIYTPNLDRLVRRGVSFTNAYSTCPVCVPVRNTIRTGCEPPATRIFTNCISDPAPGQADTIEGHYRPYLAKVMRQLGYRTFGIGKFHSSPSREPLGHDVHLHSEELYGSPEDRATDAYAARGLPASTPSTATWSNSWASARRCTTCRRRVRSRPIAPSRRGPPPAPSRLFVELSSDCERAFHGVPPVVRIDRADGSQSPFERHKRIRYSYAGDV